MTTKLCIETLVLCAAFTASVYLFVRKDRKDGLHWYPEDVQREAVLKRLTTRAAMEKRGRLTDIVGIFVSAVILLGSVYLINRTSNWKAAFLQLYFMSLILNWYDGIIIDYFWVQRTRYWVIPELSDMDIGKPWKRIIKERIISSIVFLPIAALLACIAFLTD